MCRNCGAIVGAGEKACAMCGAPLSVESKQVKSSPPLQARRNFPDMEMLRFVRAIVTRRAPFTLVLLVANIFIFLLMLVSSHAGLLNGFDYVTLAAFGAKINTFIRDGREWWRFVTPMFLHVNVIHIFTNMYGLFILGPYVEKLYGSAKFVVFWIVAGIAGVVASYFAVQPQLSNGLLGRFLFRTTETMPSAGASGALFGLIGVLFVFGIKYRHELPDDFKRAFGTGMIPTIALNLFIGFTIPFIDNSAHLGGLVAGALLALFFDYQRPYASAGFTLVWRVLQIIALALVVVSFAQVMRHFDATVKQAPQLAQESGLQPNYSLSADFLKAILNGGQAFERAVNTGDTGGIESALETLERTPALNEPTNKLKAELQEILKRAQILYSAKREDQDIDKEKKKLVEDYNAWQQRLATWVQSEGGKYGIEVKK